MRSTNVSGRVRDLRVVMSGLRVMAACGLLHPMAFAGAQGQGVPEGSDVAVLPGDLVTLQVFLEEDLTGEFRVDQHYLLTLPRLGEVDVRGETELSLRERVRRELQGSGLRNRAIELFVQKRVRVLGEVLEPGVFYLDATMSVADALAMAGGRTPLAEEGKVVLRRGGETVRTDVTEERLLAELSVLTGDELIVPQRGWASRNFASLITGSTAILAVFVAALLR